MSKDWFLGAHLGSEAGDVCQATFLPSLANDFLRRAASKAVLTLISAVENPLGLSLRFTGQNPRSHKT